MKRRSLQDKDLLLLLLCLRLFLLIFNTFWHCSRSFSSDFFYCLIPLKLALECNSNANFTAFYVLFLTFKTTPVFPEKSALVSWGCGVSLRGRLNKKWSNNQEAVNSLINSLAWSGLDLVCCPSSHQSLIGCSISDAHWGPSEDMTSWKWSQGRHSRTVMTLYFDLSTSGWALCTVWREHLKKAEL